MDITQWYAVALGTLSVSSIVFCLLWFIIGVVRTYATFYFLKHVFYSQINRHLRGSGKATRFDVVLIIGFLIGNVLCVAIGVRNTSGLVKRTGLMSTINLIPLALGSHMNLVVNRCGLGHESYGRMHRWFGRVAIVEGLVHSTVAAISQKPDLQNSSQVAALMAVSTMTAILVSSSAIVRRRFYEVFLKLHLIFAVVVITATWRHLSSLKLLVPPKVYSLVAACVMTSTHVLRLTNIFYRNLKYKRTISRAIIESSQDAVIVHAKPSRPWEFRAGQFVYLCIPGLSHSAFAQSHPFAIAWWYRDRSGNDVVVFIIEPRRGFTRDLRLHSNDILGEPTEMRTIIEGPYGKELQLGSYSTVLLFATGFGIAGQLPYIKELLNGHYNCRVMTRRIALFWEMDSELHVHWVNQWMNQMISMDCDFVLDIQLFVLGNYLSGGTKHGDVAYGGEHKKIKVIYKAPKVEDLIRSQIKGRKGRTVVSLCVNNDMGVKIRKVVRDMLDKEIRLVEVDFYPSDSRWKAGGTSRPV